MIDHDVKPGLLQRCQISGSDNLISIIDLGAQPLCDGLLDDADGPETHYPLGLNYCPDSGLAQLSYAVDGRVVYPRSYPYRSGISKPLREYQQAFADGVAARNFFSSQAPFVVDVGSNDGTLLTGFMRHNWRVRGVEPTGVALIAEEAGVPTYRAFFTTQVADALLTDVGPADLITMTNVFAHMAGLGTVMRGIMRLLAPDGVFITESHYLLDVLAKRQFDTIYHEHVRTYTLRSIQCLVEQYGLEVFDVERGDRYGGNIRAYIARKGTRTVLPAVVALRAMEDAYLSDPKPLFARWRHSIEKNRRIMMEFLYDAQRRGRTVAGCSAPGRASTLLNYYGIDQTLITYMAELPTSLKLGKYIPGARIPIVDNRILAQSQPNFVVLFAWHYADVITERLRSEGVRANLVLPLPDFCVVE